MGNKHHHHDHHDHHHHRHHHHHHHHHLTVHKYLVINMSLLQRVAAWMFAKLVNAGRTTSSEVTRRMGKGWFSEAYCMPQFFKGRKTLSPG